jgi:hypothetical protein
MHKNRMRIPKTTDERQATVSDQDNGRNGHQHPSGILSWYFAHPAAKGRTYLLTANGYVIGPNGFPTSRKELDTKELIG